MSDNLPATLPQTLPAATVPTPDRFTREQQADFLFALAGWGNVRAAARAAGVSRSTAYRMRRACARFTRAWDAALIEARPRVEEVLADRALNGVEETVFYHGEEIATRKRYDARLLLAHIGRLDRIERRLGSVAAPGRFEELLDDLLAEDEIEFVPAGGADAGAGFSPLDPSFSPLDSVSGVSKPHESECAEDPSATRQTGVK